MITGNKGEWSELYALFKLLGDKQLNVGDADLNKVEELFYPIIKIIREESERIFEYELFDDLVIITGGKEELRVSLQDFMDQSIKLLEKIKKTSGAFSNEETERFMSSIHSQTLKAKSTSKSDIRIVVYDKRINQTVELGFSIKSQLGSDATLFNASKTTNFVYHLQGFVATKEKIAAINQINSKSKIKDRITEIIQAGGSLTFHSIDNDIFKNNLVLIDSLLPEILAELLKLFFSSPLNTLKELTASISTSNPLNYDQSNNHPYYEYKIKHFLTEIALGMQPSKVWKGKYDATGGYLIIKENGEVLCYHIYNRNQFEDYLFANTKLETPSSSRHEFGKVYETMGQYYFKLNLQIRFK